MFAHTAHRLVGTSSAGNLTFSTLCDTIWQCTVKRRPFNTQALRAPLPAGTDEQPTASRHHASTKVRRQQVFLARPREGAPLQADNNERAGEFVKAGFRRGTGQCEASKRQD